jgi:hypothetical protein
LRFDGRSRVSSSTVPSPSNSTPTVIDLAPDDRTAEALVA